MAGIAAVDLLASPGMIDPEAGELLEEEVVEPWVSDCLFEEKLHDDGIYIVQREVRRTNRRSAQTLEAPPRSVHSSSRWRYPVVHRVRCPSLGGDRMDGDGSNSTGSGADAARGRPQASSHPRGDSRPDCRPCSLLRVLPSETLSLGRGGNGSADTDNRPATRP